MTAQDTIIVQQNAQLNVEWKKTVRKSESKRTEPKKIMEKRANLKVNFIFAGRLYSSFALVFNLVFSIPQSVFDRLVSNVYASARPSHVYASENLFSIPITAIEQVLTVALFFLSIFAICRYTIVNHRFVFALALSSASSVFEKMLFFLLLSLTLFALQLMVLHSCMLCTY